MSPRMRELTVLVPDQRPPTARIVKAAGAAAVGAAVIWAAFHGTELPASSSDPGPPVIGAGAEATHDGKQLVDLTPTPSPSTTTTTTPPTTTPTPEPEADIPAGAKKTPDAAAQAWYGHRGDLPADQVQILQRDRLDHDTFRLLVLAEKDHRVHTALLEVVRVGGNYWRTSKLITEQQEAG